MTRLDQLKRKLAARKGKKEYAKNCEEIEKEIARLQSSNSTTSQDA